MKFNFLVFFGAHFTFLITIKKKFTILFQNINILENNNMTLFPVIFLFVIIIIIVSIAGPLACGLLFLNLSYTFFFLNCIVQYIN